MLSSMPSMRCDDPLAASYAISRVNPAFTDESMPPCPRCPQCGEGSSGYESRSSSALSRVSQHPQDRDEGEGEAKAVDAGLDGVRQLSEGVSRSPTLLAVCRALEAGVGEGVHPAQRRGYLCYSSPWSEYLGSGIVPGDITLKARGYEQMLDLTLDAEGAARLVDLVELGSRRRCCCRAVTALLVAALFFAAIVGVSMAVSRGQRVFGAL